MSHPNLTCLSFSTVFLKYTVMGENVIRKIVQDLIDNPIGNPNLEHYWEQKMTVYFKKTEENDKQVRFGWLISQLNMMSLF
jgi:hypothetical protein